MSNSIGSRGWCNRSSQEKAIATAQPTADQEYAIPPCKFSVWIQDIITFRCYRAATVIPSYNCSRPRVIIYRAPTDMLSLLRFPMTGTYSVHGSFTRHAYFALKDAGLLSSHSCACFYTVKASSYALIPVLRLDNCRKPIESASQYLI